MVLGSNPVEVRFSIPVQTGTQDQHSFLLNWYQGSFLGVKQPGHDNHSPNLVPRSWMGRAIPLLSPFVHSWIHYMLKVTFAFTLHHRSFVITKWYLLFTFSSQYSVCLSCTLYVFYMPHIAHPPWFDHTNIIWLCWLNWIVYMKVHTYGEGINLLLIFGKE